MIPKIIHYCWLSGDPFPESIQKCIDSWKQHLPDYEFVLWDRSRFDIDTVPYVRDAFAAKKYAFCADYIRMYALHTMGGIYLDSDVMVYKPLDPFLRHQAFSSVEYHSYFTYANISNKRERMVGIEAAVIGAEKGSEWTRRVLDYLGAQTFSTDKKKIERNIMPRVMARILAEHYGFKYLPVFQILSNGMHIYPAEVFSSKTPEDCEIKYATHMCANSWNYDKGSFRASVRRILDSAGLLAFTRRMRGIENH